MSWRIIVLALLGLGLTAVPVAAQTPLVGSYQDPPPPPSSDPPRPAPGSVSAVTGAAQGYEVTVSGGRWPYNPPATPAPFVVPVPPSMLLLLNVSVANTGSSPMSYSTANFRLRVGDATLTPTQALAPQPALGNGQLSGASSPGLASSTAQGYVTFDVDTDTLRANYDRVFLDYTPADTPAGIPMPPLSLQLDIAR